MFSLVAMSRKARTTRVIDAGVVFCPRKQGDVDVEQCLGCGWLEAFDDQGQWLRCDPPPPMRGFF